MITIVSPWYGPDTHGGAENQARSLTRALHGLGVPVRVWASTGRDSFHPGEDNHYSAGAGELDGIPLWRFRPSETGADGVPDFFRRRPALLPDLAQFAPHELRLLGTLLSSDELYAAILAERGQTRFIFLPYPFPTSFWGALLAPEASYLLPCLHDEPYARYNTYRYLFTRVRGVLANSPAEAAFAQRLYGLRDERVCVAGEGIDLGPRGDGMRFKRRLARGDWGLEIAAPTHNLQSPISNILLYIGRRDESKNIPLLLAYLREYWARRGVPLLLIMAGQGKPESGEWLLAIGTKQHHLQSPVTHLPIIDLGYLDEQTKHDAYAAADLFVQPSLHESFSIVLMEAWLQGAPALVHAGCAVTADHAWRSGGGLAFNDFGAFAAALDLLLSRPDLRQSLGERGRAYVLETCRWDAVARRTAEFVKREA